MVVKSKVLKRLAMQVWSVIITKIVVKSKVLNNENGRKIQSTQTSGHAGMVCHYNENSHEIQSTQ